MKSSYRDLGPARRRGARATVLLVVSCVFASACARDGFAPDERAAQGVFGAMSTKFPFCTDVPAGTTSLILSPANWSAAPGDSIQFSVKNQAGVEVPVCALRWSSSDEALATVTSQGGAARALAVGGPVTISVHSTGKNMLRATASVTIAAVIPGPPGGGLGLILTENLVNSTLWRLRADGTGSLPAPNGLYHADLSYDGSKLVYTRAGSQTLWTSNVDGSGEVAVSTFSAPQLVPRWSRDGLKLVLTRDYWGAKPREVFAMNVDGSATTQLTNNGVMDHEGQWSPDGMRIVFFSQRDGAGDIYLMNADGSGVARLTVGLLAGSPEFSPDGQKIVFIAQSPSSGVYVMNADGTGIHALVNDACLNFGESGPHFSPDGTRVAFVACYGAAMRDVYTIRLDGTGLTRLTNTPTIDEYVRSWR